MYPVLVVALVVVADIDDTDLRSARVVTFHSHLDDGEYTLRQGEGEGRKRLNGAMDHREVEVDREVGEGVGGRERMRVQRGLPS